MGGSLFPGFGVLGGLGGLCFQDTCERMITLRKRLKVLNSEMAH